MFKKGDSKPANSGRKKGIGNHATKRKREDAQATFSRLNFNPIVEAIRLFRKKGTSMDEKIKLCAELLRYHSPKLSTSAVAHTLEGNLHVEAVQSLLMTADEGTIKALEAASLELSRMERAQHQAMHVDPHLDRQIIDVQPLALEAGPILEPRAEPGAPGDG